MKKHILYSVVTAISVVTNVEAAVPYIDPYVTTEVYISGSSSQLGFIKQLIVGTPGMYGSERICDPSKEIWQFNSNISANDTSTYYAADQSAWYCTTSYANTKLQNVKNHLLIFKRSKNGSDYGVAPIASNSAIAFLDRKSPSCSVTTPAVAGTTIGVITCGSTTVNQVPDLGISDVDPHQFISSNVSTGLLAIQSTDLAKLNIQSTSVVVFGEVVTLNLYKALQAAQLAIGEIPATTIATIAYVNGGKVVNVGDTVACIVGDRINEGCMPNLSSAQIANIHTGLVFDWNLIQVGSTGLGLYDWTIAHAPDYAPAVSSVHIVRRENGSGAQAQHGIIFLNYPCDLSASTATPAVIDIGQSENIEGYVVHEMPSAGAVNNALNSLDTGVANVVFIAGTNASASTWAGGRRWAVGLNSLENKGSNFEFVRIDGVAPTLANVVAGKYRDWVENTLQYNINHYSNDILFDTRSVIDSIISLATKPEVVSVLNSNFTHGFGNGAYLTLPSKVIRKNNVYDSAYPVGNYSRTPNGTSVDSCRTPTVYQDGVFPFLSL